MASEADFKMKADVEFLQAQTEKIRAEIAKLQKDLKDRKTFFFEVIKVVGALVLGVGGTIAAFSGYQLSEVKKERADFEAKKTIEVIEEKNKEAKKLDTQLKALVTQRDVTAVELKELSDLLVGLKAEIAASQDIAQSKSNTQGEGEKALNNISDRIQEVDSQLKRTVVQVSEPSPPASTMKAKPAVSAATAAGDITKLAQGLFEDTPQERWLAFDRLSRHFVSDPTLVPKLLGAGEQRMENKMGSITPSYFLIAWPSINSPHIVVECCRSSRERGKTDQTRCAG